jgi:hypothetical protein
MEIEKIHKKDIPSFLRDRDFSAFPFLPISRHRLISHYNNPTCEDDDVVLLLAYSNNVLVGYMGIYMDLIGLDGVVEKIGWLSTWWVDPKTKGSGIGRKILETMYEVNAGKIGISQFTPSAKRVYDKSGYFYTLKVNEGIKAVLRSNFSLLMPLLFPKFRAQAAWKILDGFFNFFIDLKLALQKRTIISSLKDIIIEYQNVPDPAAEAIINKFNQNHISQKTTEFFEWLRKYNWVLEAPLIEMTDKDRYEFSMYARKFSIYYLKVMQRGACIGFITLQKRDDVCKVLFAYYDKTEHSDIISNIIKLQAINQNIKEVVTYDDGICTNFNKSGVFIYKRKKTKQSIISKAFQKENFDDVTMNFGDGDCSFA